MMVSKFLTFGSISVEKLSKLIFGTGAIGILIAACIGGRNVYLTHAYDTLIKQGDWYTGAQVNNLPLGIAYGVVYFLLGTLSWRLICEIVYIILTYFKTNTKENV
jgi:hypothetical protein